MRILQRTITKLQSFNNKNKCVKCGGQGWVLWYQLDNFPEPKKKDYLNKHDCDWCNK